MAGVWALRALCEPGRVELDAGLVPALDRPLVPPLVVLAIGLPEAAALANRLAPRALLEAAARAGRAPAAGEAAQDAGMLAEAALSIRALGSARTPAASVAGDAARRAVGRLERIGAGLEGDAPGDPPPGLRPDGGRRPDGERRPALFVIQLCPWEEPAGFAVAIVRSQRVLGCGMAITGRKKYHGLFSRCCEAAGALSPEARAGRLPVGPSPGSARTMLAAEAELFGGAEPRWGAGPGDPPGREEPPAWRAALAASALAHCARHRSPEVAGRWALAGGVDRDGAEVAIAAAGEGARRMGWISVIGGGWAAVLEQPPEVVFVCHAAHRAPPPARRGVPAAMRNRVWGLFAGPDAAAALCPSCGLRMLQSAFQAGHIRAAAHGGPALVGNLLPLCPSCNTSLRDEDLDAFAARSANGRLAAAVAAARRWA